MSIFDIGTHGSAECDPSHVRAWLTDRCAPWDPGALALGAWHVARVDVVLRYALLNNSACREGAEVQSLHSTVTVFSTDRSPN